METEKSQLLQMLYFIKPKTLQELAFLATTELVKAMGMSGISKSQVSRLCEEIDERVQAFLDRPIEGDWPYLWIDATYVKAHRSAGGAKGGPSSKP